jgi:hypothetical protein
MSYYQINLANVSIVSGPGHVPDMLAGLSDEILADVGRYIVPAPPGMEGQGWWPMVVTAPTSFDPASQAVVDPTSFTADPATATVRGQQTTRAMTAEEFKSANPVPESVTNYQARAVLVQDGLFAKVNAAIRGADMSKPESQLALQAWDYANSFYRTSPFIVGLGPAFGLSVSDIDNLFRAAAKVT